MLALGALAAAMVVGPTTAAHADEPYGGIEPTETIIEVTITAPNQPISIKVHSTSEIGPPEGDIAIAINASSAVAKGARAVAAAPLFTTTVHFVNTPITVAGPGLPVGTYIGTASLTPTDPNVFLPSTGVDPFKIGEIDNEDIGNLPNTGGPNMMWLLLGGGLLTAGAGGVGYGRRRNQALA